MKHLKRIITAWIVSALIGLLGIVFIIVAVNEVVTSIFGQDQQESNITDDMLDGLPDWITIDMVQAAISMMNETGYPASVVLGQMILEAGVEGSELSDPPYYNCLGLKSPSYLETGTISMITQESWGTITGDFSTFASYTDCMLAWAHRFSRNPYALYVEACIRDPVTGHYDANAFIQAIWEAGYATDPDYVDKVISVMTSYDLYKFNNMTNIAIPGTGNGSVDEMPYYYQNDYAHISYGSSNLAACGCGPTSFAMVASAITGSEITPDEAVAWCGNAYYVSGAGTSWSYFAAASNHFNLGVDVVQLSPSSSTSDAVLQALRNGNPVICSQEPGLFTRGGHFIVLSGIDSNGKISVHDPNKNNAVNKNYNSRKFDFYSEINVTAKQYFIFQ